MKFLMVIGRNAIFTYAYEGKEYVPQLIEGSEKYLYNVNNISYEIETYLTALANEKNLGTKAKLEFDVLESSDPFCNSMVMNYMETYIEKKYDINNVMKEILKKLSRDESLLIEEYGVNYDGVSFVLKDNEIKKQPYNLLAYRIGYDDLIQSANI
ncbi:MAG: hypothetical protein J6A03_09935 [Lachnospiraceae bacterium]|nr:hypothetical protein [Lachnospiraceae bacterium]